MLKRFDNSPAVARWFQCGGAFNCLIGFLISAMLFAALFRLLVTC